MIGNKKYIYRRRFCGETDVNKEWHKMSQSATPDGLTSPDLCHRLRLSDRHRPRPRGCGRRAWRMRSSAVAGCAATPPPAGGLLLRRLRGRRRGRRDPGCGRFRDARAAARRPASSSPKWLSFAPPGQGAARAAQVHDKLTDFLRKSRDTENLTPNKSTEIARVIPLTSTEMI